MSDNHAPYDVDATDAEKAAKYDDLAERLDRLQNAWTDICDDNAELRFETNLNREIRKCALALLAANDQYPVDMFHPEREALRHALDGELPARAAE